MNRVKMAALRLESSRNSEGTRTPGAAASSRAAQVRHARDRPHAADVRRVRGLKAAGITSTDRARRLARARTLWLAVGNLNLPKNIRMGRNSCAWLNSACRLLP